jgi:hypothetical protein
MKEPYEGQSGQELQPAANDAGDIGPMLRKIVLWTMLIVAVPLLLILKTAGRKDFGAALGAMLIVGMAAFLILWLLNETRNMRVPDPAKWVKRKQEEAAREKRERDIT